MLYLKGMRIIIFYYRGLGFGVSGFGGLGVQGLGPVRPCGRMVREERFELVI